MRKSALLVAGMFMSLIAIGACQTDPATGSTTTLAGGDTTTSVPFTGVVGDGEWFAYVNVGRDESGAVAVGVDVAEVLSGQAAIEAAIEAGVISEGEDLPNDFFIVNPEEQFEIMTLARDVEIQLLAGDQVETYFEVDPEDLEAVFEGTFDGRAVYGVVPGTPMPMTVTVADGVVTGLRSFYLP